MIKEPDFNKLKEDMDKLNSYLSENEEDIDFNMIYDEYGVDIKGLEEDMLNHTGKLDLAYKRLNSDSISPYYNYESDSGFDLYSTEEITIGGLGRALIPTGLSFDIKDGYEIQVRSKSGLAINQGLMCLNSPGTVDSGYLGEVKVIIFNTNKEPFTIKKGMKIAQAVLCPVVNGKWVSLVEKTEMSEKDRGDNGFGSTGI
jgi:dUTP pyrophosphatase